MCCAVVGALGAGGGASTTAPTPIAVATALSRPRRQNHSDRVDVRTGGVSGQVAVRGAFDHRPPKCCRRPLGEQLAKQGRHPSRRHRGVPGSTCAGFAGPAGPERTAADAGGGCVVQQTCLQVDQQQRSAAGPHQRYHLSWILVGCTHRPQCPSCPVYGQMW